jgi:hypothetical protein
MKRMLELVFALLALTGSSLAFGDTSCSVIDGDDARPSLSVDNGTICFKLQHLLDKKGNPLIDEDMQISVYFVQQEQEPIKIGELPYMATTGNIEDVFQLDADKDGKKDIIIIHSAEIRAYTGSCKASPWYSISIYRQTESGFEYNRRASSWFGDGLDLADGSAEPDKETCNNDKLIYVYPYKTRDVIEQALSSSPFSKLMTNAASLAATVVRKSNLYNGTTVEAKTKKYLIAGDKVMVDRVEADWCLITYTGGKKPLQMYVLCNDLKLDSMDTEESHDNLP